MRPGPEGWWIPSLTASRLFRTRSDFVTSRVVLATEAALASVRCRWSPT